MSKPGRTRPAADIGELKSGAEQASGPPEASDWGVGAESAPQLPVKPT